MYHIDIIVSAEKIRQGSAFFPKARSKKLPPLFLNKFDNLHALK